MENARLLIFETYCRIHQCIDLAMLADKLNMDKSAAETWVVNLIRNARLNAKIDSQVLPPGARSAQRTWSTHPAGSRRPRPQAPGFASVAVFLQGVSLRRLRSHSDERCGWVAVPVHARGAVVGAQAGTVVMGTSFPMPYEAVVDKTRGLSQRCRAPPPPPPPPPPPSIHTQGSRAPH